MYFNKRESPLKPQKSLPPPQKAYIFAYNLQFYSGNMKSKEIIVSCLSVILGIALQILPDYIEPLIYPAPQLREFYQVIINIISLILIGGGGGLLLVIVLSKKK